LHNPADKQTNTDENITSLAEVINCKIYNIRQKLFMAIAVRYRSNQWSWEAAWSRIQWWMMI